MIRTSETINELSEGFAKAQAKFGAAIKASQNPAFRSKYADLASVIDATLEHLNAEGIGVMQHPALRFYTEGEERIALVTVTTRLQHRSGQWMESDVELPAVQRERFDAQSVGSAITYACRYALRSICTVPQADDDGNEASGVGTHEAAQAVGQAKLAKLKEKTAPSASQTPLTPIPTLFFTYPDSHNGHKAEWVNIANFLSTRPDIELQVRTLFTSHKATKTKSDTALVPREHMQALCEQLVGEMGLNIKELSGAHA